MEIIVNIAGFLAGANNYGTLMNLSMMSKRVREECLPTCFETFIPAHTDDLMRTLKVFGWQGYPQPPHWYLCR
jgi:hypothetical protein